MNVIVTTLEHFYKTPDGRIYPYCFGNYTFWQRYLGVFDQVVVNARVRAVESLSHVKRTEEAGGMGVIFHEIPDFQGIVSCLKHYGSVRRMARELLSTHDALILRIPSFISTEVWKIAKAQNRPYAVEVLGDPWQALAPSTTNSLMRPLIRRRFHRQMVKECQHATVAAYVTERELQKRYPPGQWSTHYSSIDLPADDIIDDMATQARIARVDQKVRSQEPWRLCFVGSLWHLCKSPDVVIDAVALCVQSGCQIDLTIVGDGSMRAQLEAQARRLGIGARIEFVGHLPPGQAINQQLDRADLFLLPSRSEGLPRSIIEAFARGLPCIGGHAGGFAELLDDQYMVKPINKEMLAEMILRILRNPEEMKLAIRRNVEKAREYESSVLQDRRDEAYRRLKEATQNWIDS